MIRNLFCASLIRSVAALSYLALAALPAAAQQSVDEERRARALIDGLFEHLSWQLNLQAQSGALPALSIEHEYQLSGADGRYTAQFGQADLQLGGLVVDLLPLSIAVEPRAEGLAAVAIDLPERIEMSEDGETVATLSTGSRRIEALWDEAHKTLAESELRLQDIELRFNDPEAPTVSAAVLRGEQGFDIAEDRSDWSQSLDLALEKFSVAASDGVLEIADLGLQAETGGADYAAMLRQIERYQALSAEDLGDPESFAKLGIEYLRSLFDSEFRYRGVVTAGNAGFSRDGESQGRVGGIEFGTEAAVESEQGRFGYHISVTEIDVPATPLPPQLRPREARFSVEVGGISKALVDQAIEMAEQTAEMEEAEAQMVMQLQLPALLLSSPLQLAFVNNYAQAEAAGVTFDAKLATRAGSALGLVGDLELVVRGLPLLLETAGMDASQPGLAQMLATFVAFSERSEVDGEVVDTFRLQLSEDGKVLLNGKDISALTGLAPPQ